MRVHAAIILAALFCAVALGGEAEPPPTEEARPPETVPELIEQMAQDDFAGMQASRRLAARGPAAVEPLVEALDHDVPRVRYWSIAALSSIGDERAVPAIKRLLDDPNELVRSVAVWHLGAWWHREDVREAVLAKLHDPSLRVRGWVLELVRTKRYADALDRIRPLLAVEEPELRYDALHAVAVLEGWDALALLKKVLREDESPLVRQGAVRCTTVIDPPTPEVGDVLIVALRDGDADVREAAVGLLRKGFGQYFGYDPEAEPLARERAVRQWRAWYEASKDALRWSRESRRFEPADEHEPEPGEAAGR